MSALEKKLLSKLQRASKKFGMIKPNDRIMVALSGGKDSYVLLHLIKTLKKKIPFKLSFFALHIDQGLPNYDGKQLREFLDKNHYDFRIIKQNTFQIVQNKTETGKSYCSLCARLRRGIIYRVAKENNVTKIALGHHRDDAIETLFLNLFFAGKIASMPPKLRARDGNTIIRPLILCDERDIQAFSDEQAFPILKDAGCVLAKDSQRDNMKKLVDSLQREIPRVKGSIMAALGNVEPSHLHDLELYERFNLPVFSSDE